jgi:arabinofuranosyltransferase
MRNQNQIKLAFFVFLIIISLFILHCRYLAVIAEDAFISFRFAKNLVSGNGLVWNLTEPPVEGYSNFLWVMLNAIALYLDVEVTLFSQFAGMVAGILVLVYVYRFAQNFLSKTRWGAFLPPLFLACSGPFAAWACSGLETTFFTLWVVAAAYYTVSWQACGNIKTLSLAFSSALIATLSRPEGFGIFAVLVLIILFLQNPHHQRKKHRTTFFLALFFYIIPFSIYFIWRFSYFGFLLPNTFYAKTGGGYFQWYRGLCYLFYFGFHYLLPFIPLPFLILWNRAQPLVKFKLFQPASRSRAALMCLSLTVTYSVYIIWVGGDYMAMYRFLVPILPFIYLLISYGFMRLFEKGPTPVQRFVLIALLLFSIAATIVHSTPLEERLFTKPTMTHGQYRGIQTERWHSRRLTAIGHFFKNYAQGENAGLATDAIGAVGFYSELEIYGLHGLVDPVIAHRHGKNIGKGLPGHEKASLAYTLAKQPTFFMFNRELTPKPMRFPSFNAQIMNLLQNYELKSFWIKDKGNQKQGYFTFLQRERH